jgi:hypothetical protein
MGLLDLSQLTSCIGSLATLGYVNKTDLGVLQGMLKDRKYKYGGLERLTGGQSSEVLKNI